MAKNTEELDRLCRIAMDRYGASALWWLRRDLDFRRSWPHIVKGLRTNGGHEGMILAQKIQEVARNDQSSKLLSATH